MHFIILLLFIFLSPVNVYSKGNIYSQTYFQYDVYVSENIKGFDSGFFLPNGSLGFNLNIFNLAFFRISISMDISYFQFNQSTTFATETNIANTEKIFQNIENNILSRLKEIQSVKQELHLISIEKVKEYTEEFGRKLNIQFQTNLNEKLLTISEDFVPKPETQANIIKKAFAGVIKTFANNINFAKPFVSLIPGAGQAIAAVLPVVEGTLNTISGVISSTIEKSVEPDTEAYKTGSIIEKIPSIGWIGSIIKAVEEEKLRRRLINIRKNRLKELDVSVARYRIKAQRPGGMKSLKAELESFKNKKYL